MQRLRNMWGETGDYISIQYAGTCSTISEVTKTQKQSVKGKLSHMGVSLKRFYKNNISSKEETRQECIDLLCGRHNLSTTHQEQDMESQLMKNEHEFSNINQYSVGILTWNLAGNAPTADLSFEEVAKSQKF